jgi:serine/threonine-protein kinase
MAPDRWQHILEVFNVAAERDSADRDAYLDDACADDADLRAEVASLLATYDEDPAFLEDPAARIPEPPAEVEETMEGQRAGPYKILRCIGEGGMGAVYLALRDDDQYRKQVALKLVKRGMDTDEILRRFRSERQILAALDHPHIARLLDGGMTDDGRPYFVMAYIEDAVPINTYCDQHRLPVRERLRLFQQVCAAVQFAHQNLIIHRDLKPSNILVSKQGEVKLLDFGIAKLLNPNLSPFTLAQTRTEMRLLTPEYASPEQVRAGAITTASDVYQLGVLLYELLTGHRPYHLKSRATEDVARIICEEEPTKPSTVVARTAVLEGAEGDTETITPEAVSAARSTELAALRRGLAGDLDTIVLKAMHKEPQRRYTSVEALAEDVTRFLTGQTVSAQPDTVGYRVGKFVQRHRLGVAAAAVIFLLVLSFGVMMAVQASRIARQADEIAQERDKAEAVSTFLADLFEGADPTKSSDPDITAREMLDVGVEKVRDELADQPAVQARLLTLIGGIYRKLGLYDPARSTLADAIAVYRKEGGPAEGLGTALLELGNVEYRLDQFEAAEPLLNEGLALKQTALGPDHPEVAGILNSLALVYEELGRIDEARATLRKVIAIRRQQPGDEPNENLAVNLNNLANMLNDAGEVEEAEAMYREAIDILEAKYGQEHPYIAFLFNSLAGLHQDQGDFEQAEADLERARAISYEFLGEEHPFTAVVHHNLGRLFYASKDYAAAIPQFTLALDLRRRTLPEGNPDIAASLDGLGTALIESGQASAAEPHLREALAIRQQVYEEGDWRIAQVEGHLGKALVRQGRYAEAEPLLVRSYEILQATRGSDDLHTRYVLTALVDWATATRQPDHAATYQALLADMP